MADGSIQRIVPRSILNAIKQHVRQASERGESGWRSARHSEDTLTGHWASAVQTDWSGRTEEEGYFWRWRIDYRKFSSASEEPFTGADGIFQIEIDRSQVEVSPVSPSTVSIENVQSEYSFRKGILFQAKKKDSTKREVLVGQLQDIEKLVPGDGCYVEFGPDQYQAAAAQDVIRVNGYISQLPSDHLSRLGDFLADKFLECKNGVEGLYFDFDHNELYFPAQTNQLDHVRAKIKHGLKVRVSAFKMSPFSSLNRR